MKYDEDSIRPHPEGPVVVYTFREVLERLEGKIDRLSATIDKDLEGLEERVQALETFRARFIPMTALVGVFTLMVLLLEILGHVVPGFPR